MGGAHGKRLVVRLGPPGRAVTASPSEPVSGRVQVPIEAPEVEPAPLMPAVVTGRRRKVKWKFKRFVRHEG
jgi:hypothetical protein